MATISSAGVGSGLDVASIVNQLMAAERQPLSVLAKKEAGYQAQLSAYGTLKGSLSAFQSAMQGLSSLAKFQSVRATSADATVYAASAASTAVAGSYSIEVTKLAQAHKLASSTAFTNTTDTVGTGTLTIQFGTTIAGVFTANSAKASQTVTIGSANSTLSGVRDAINAAKVGVSAAILNDGTGNKLVLTSNDTGAANSLKITVADTSDASNTDNAGLSQLAYDPAAGIGTGKNLTETVVAQNATLNVDGIIGISKASNTVTDVIQGVTLNLLKVSAAATPTILTVATDTASVTSAVQNFVKTYNDLNKTIKDLTAYDAKTKQSAVLQGDTSTLSIITQVRRVLNQSLTGLTGTYTQLSQIGISFQNDGALALDATKLQTAVTSNFSDIAGLFANIGKPSDSLVNYVSSTSKTVAGSYSLNVTQLATKGALSGVNTSFLAHTAGTFTVPFAITASNNTLSVKIDGVQSGTITLAQGNYATSDALIAEIQSKINGDSVLKAASSSVAVTFDKTITNSWLAIASNRYGSASKVEVTAVGTSAATTLGLSVAAGTDGVDVAGSIDGVTATGSGRYLVGASGNTDGLKLEIVGGATGSRGTVGYSFGYADLLSKLADRLQGTNGPISSRTTGINSSITDINNRREALNRSLVSIERRYRAEFTALDTLMSKLRSTSDYLTRQLANLPGAKA